MKTGTIFGFLTDYKQPETYQEHPTIRLDTLYGAGEYEVFAAFAIDITADRSFAYNNYIDLTKIPSANSWKRSSAAAMSTAASPRFTATSC